VPYSNILAPAAKFLVCVSPYIRKCILNNRALSINHGEILISSSLVEAGIVVVVIVSMLWARWFRVWFPTKERHFSCLRNAHTSSVVQTACYSMGYPMGTTIFSGCKTAGSWI